MTHYRHVGDVPRKRHSVHRGLDGSRRHEELLGVRGFSGPSSLLYHRSSPSSITAIEAMDDTDCTTARTAATLGRPDPSAPTHLRTGVIGQTLADTRDLVLGRQVLLGNRDLRIAVVDVAEPSPLYRSAVGDELVFLTEGSARLESVFGVLDVAAGDYVVVPAGVTHRWVPDGLVRALVVEASGHVAIPARYRAENGQLLEQAPFCERDLRAPTEPLVVDEPGPASVVVRTATGWARHRHTAHPFDVVGWDGSLYPYAFAISDFEPIVGSIHQPPPVHQTFEGPGFVVCSFVPRPFDFHPDAVKVPYHHHNVDSDEVLFYVDGDFMSRRGSGIDVGSLSWHPAGFVHGPQPGSFEASVDATRTEETAVMIDTFAPLQISEIGRAVADPDYLRSWAPNGDRSTE